MLFTGLGHFGCLCLCYATVEFRTIAMPRTQLIKTKKFALQAAQELGLSFAEMCDIVGCEEDSIIENNISYESYRRLLLLLKFHGLVKDKFNNDHKKIYNWMNSPIRFNGESNKMPKFLIKNEFNMNRLISLLMKNDEEDSSIPEIILN